MFTQAMLSTTARGNVGAPKLLLQEFDTVLAATGRTADTQGLGLENLGVALTKSGKVTDE